MAVEESGQLAGHSVFQLTTARAEVDRKQYLWEFLASSFPTGHPDMRRTDHIIPKHDAYTGVCLHSQCFIEGTKKQSPGDDVTPLPQTPPAPFAGLPSAGDKSFFCGSKSSNTQGTHKHWNLPWAQSHPTHVQQHYQGVGNKIA